MPEGTLRIKANQECRWDILSLGEVMLRFDPETGELFRLASLMCGRVVENTMWRAG